MLISKAAMEADRTVAIYSLPRLLALLRDTFNDGTEYSLNELIDRLCSVDLLHIDDVGAEQSSPWVLEQLYTIVNTRYEDGRALLLTTNLDRIAELRRRRSATGPSRASTRSAAATRCRCGGRPDQDCGLPVHSSHRAGGGPAARCDEDAIWEGAAPSRYGRPLD